MSHYTSPTAPKKHQVEYHKRLAQRPRRPSPDDVMALLAEMGTGKTKMVLDEWQERVGKGDLSDLLVVAPAGSYSNWYEDKSDEQISELRKHLDPALLKDLVVGAWVSGGGRTAHEKLSRVLTAPAKKPRALFINVEAFSTVQDARDVAKEFLSRGRSLFAVDESTTIKGESTRTRQIMKIKDLAPTRRIMTGLVSPRSPMDLFRQYEFLDWRIIGQRNWFAYRARYAVLKDMEQGGRRFKVIVGYKNVQELQQRIAPYSHRVLKEDCLDLDPKTYLTRDVELTKEQRRIYKELKEYATAELTQTSYVTATSVITQIMRLHQVVCGHTRSDEEGVLHDIESNRVDAVLDVLEEHSGKAVIWTCYTHELQKIADALRKRYKDPRVAATFWGGNRGDRAEEERRFLGDPRCRFMVATQSAGGRGNTWTVADLEIYAASSYDLEMRLQSEDRCHRVGQTRPVTIVDLVARGTVEERIIHALRKKIDMATAITGETYRQWLI